MKIVMMNPYGIFYDVVFFVHVLSLASVVDSHQGITLDPCIDNLV